MTYNNYVKVYEQQLEDGWNNWGRGQFQNEEQFKRYCYEMFNEGNEE